MGIYVFCYLFILVLDIFRNLRNYSPIVILYLFFTVFYELVGSLLTNNNTVNRTYYAG